MPLLQVGYYQPQALFGVLHEMDIPKGAEITIEKVESGILLKHLTPDGVLNRQGLRELLKERAIEMAERDLQMAQGWFP
ncbi:MAG: hypothetical protein HY774_19480 [Acidobacteria bacterium]|nr:hypothetical protein [Acidobacteriota bacterium]